MLVKIEIPISNYEGDDVFYKTLYISCDYSPSFEDVVKRIEKLKTEDDNLCSNIGAFSCHEWSECLLSLSKAEKKQLPIVSYDGLQQSNIFTKYPQFGSIEERFPITIKLIIPEVL